MRKIIDVARLYTSRSIKAVETARRPGDPPVLVASNEKTREELGWAPEKPSLEAMISDAWDWMQKQPRGYDE